MKRDIFTRDWIIEQALDVLSQYEPGVLTIRALHYQLVSRGMTNDIQHYKRVWLLPGLQDGMAESLSMLSLIGKGAWPPRHSEIR